MGNPDSIERFLVSWKDLQKKFRPGTTLLEADQV
jgi:hypothetical protein